MSAILGSLALRVNSIGLAKATKGMGKLQANMGKFTKRMEPAFKKMSKTLSKFGAVATGAFFSLAAASPLLQARLEVLNLRVQELLRVFGDELAPVVEGLTDIVVMAKDAWDKLPAPLQDAIKFGATLAIVVGILAGAFVVLSAAMSPVTLAIIAIAIAAALLYLAWTTNFGGIQEKTKAVFEKITPLFEQLMIVWENITKALKVLDLDFGISLENIGGYFGLWFDAIALQVGWVIDTLTGIVTFFNAIFAGDIDAALEAIKGIFYTQLNFIVSYIKLPLQAVKDLILGLKGFHKKMQQAGKELFMAFLKGMQEAIDAAGGLLKEGLDQLGDWLGGSLPEKGPLMKVPHFGEELGQAYVAGIVSGFEGAGGTSIFNRTFNIETLSLEVPGATETEGRGFMRRMDEGLRRATF